ncbi:hypothetical protein P8S54_07245 [Thiomicrospira sp. R3]|uniref:hypothetical protein n=1 Tax=Thiomicrospira sp. R3 TaxID=3035472 RepID=UPI00259B689B|nr:hypothetical protein [Thiomicrospira sp. R3]WFE68020.1 hypothetical protein P8S54_07245 [Thiomicrospira sp. R3]
MRAQFRTLKYQPDYLRRSNNYDHAMRGCQDYITWYNHEHHQVFDSQVQIIAQVRQQALDAAY